MVAAPTTFEFTLEVCDEADPTSLCDTDTVTITVNPVVVGDTAPTADAGPDQTVDEGDLVTLDGTGSSDPEGETLTYEWTAPAGITLSDPTSASPTFTAPDVAAPTTFEFTLEVCDEADPTSLCATDTVTITVNPVVVGDTAPTADAGPDQTVDEGDLVTLDGTGSSDPEGETLTYEWTAPAGITLSDPTSASPTFTAPDVTAPTTFEFTLEVCDEADPTSLCATDTVTITVNPVVVGDTAPTADAGPDQTVDEGDLVTLDGTGSSDPEGETLTYEWTAPAGITLSDPTSASPTFTAPDVTAPTTFEFTLEVCDEADPTSLCATDTVTITVNPVVVGEVDASGVVKVNNHLNPKKAEKVWKLRVTNLGSSPITVNPADIDASVEVNGTPNGSVEVLTGTMTIKPGHGRNFQLRWTQDGTLAVGDSVEFIACVNLAGDTNTANNCGSETRTAVGKPRSGS